MPEVSPAAVEIFVVLYKPHSVDEVYCRMALLQRVLVQVMGGGCFSIQPAVSRQHGRSGGIPTAFAARLRETLWGSTQRVWRELRRADEHN
jgi:hypothetical protein